MEKIGEIEPELNGPVETALFVEGGAHPTPVIDRFWFKSVYFREPGGVLFRAGDGRPGFGVDEDHAALGESLVLPPWLEADRAAVEAVRRDSVAARLPNEFQASNQQGENERGPQPQHER